MTLRLNRILLAVLMMAFTAATGAMGDDREHENETENNEREAVRAAVERGELKSLSNVLQAVRPKLPGEVVGNRNRARAGSLDLRVSCRRQQRPPVRRLR